MKFTVIVLDEVYNDLNNGVTFYDRIEQGIGSYFFDSLISDIESLQIYAGIHDKYYGLYKMLSKRFPFSIYYDLYDNFAVVFAVLDMRRNPTWLKNSIGNRKRKQNKKNPNY